MAHSKGGSPLVTHLLNLHCKSSNLLDIITLTTYTQLLSTLSISQDPGDSCTVRCDNFDGAQVWRLDVACACVKVQARNLGRCSMLLHSCLGSPVGGPILFRLSTHTLEVLVYTDHAGAPHRGVHHPWQDPSQQTTGPIFLKNLSQHGRDGDISLTVDLRGDLDPRLDEIQWVCDEGGGGSSKD